MEKEMKVRCSIDDKEVDCKELKEQPIDEEEWIRIMTTGGGAET
tara:strand:- start:395 stop:526 length:132 start_codon:yes stop_codon:yes gene_type:complete